MLQPLHLRKPGLGRIGQAGRGLTEHGEVPQQRIAALPIGLQLDSCDALGQPLRLLGSVNHLGEQQVRPHAAA